LLAEHHYLGGVKAVGEQLNYAVSDGQGEWLAVFVSSWVILSAPVDKV